MLTGEEFASELGEPVRIDRCDNRHVLFARQDELGVVKAGSASMSCPTKPRRETHFVIDDIVGQVSETVQRRGGVEMHRNCHRKEVSTRVTNDRGARGAQRLTSCPQVLELANTLDAGGLVEVCTADRPPNHVPVCAARDDVELLVLHDVQELGPYFPRLAQRLGVQEVASCPRVRVAVESHLG